GKAKVPATTRRGQPTRLRLGSVESLWRDQPVAARKLRSYETGDSQSMRCVSDRRLVNTTSLAALYNFLYRASWTPKHAEAIYVLHALEKKSHHMRRADLEIGKSRFQAVETMRR